MGAGAGEAAVVGVDIGTSSSKGVLVALDGRILATAVREHRVSRPVPGWVEMDADTWWNDFVSIARELVDVSGADIISVGVSGMGPCLLMTDADDSPLRPAILYGVDTRSVSEIDQLNSELGAEAILERGGSALSTQAIGPKLRWVASNEPGIFARARRMYMPSSWLARRLTGAYVLDFHSASQCNPLFDSKLGEWHTPWADTIAGHIELPPLRWPGEVCGTVTEAASAETGLPFGIPVITGTIDAWSEALSVGAVAPGDLMLMYGTTMFLINTVAERMSAANLWGTLGAAAGTFSLAGGMATSGAITEWLRGLFETNSFAELTRAAELSGPGSRGLLMLPYFAGERTPIADPAARGVISGLTLEHGRGDLYRAALEATAFGVRHNIEALLAANSSIERVFAVGGGTLGRLWTQIVSDVIGIDQVVATITIGASFGAAFLAASAIGEVSIAQWNPQSHVVRARVEHRVLYDERFALYRELYPATKSINHSLAAIS